MKEQKGSRKEEMSAAEWFVSPEGTREREERNRVADEALESAARHLARAKRLRRSLRR